jgi:hypothetical protein
MSHFLSAHALPPGMCTSARTGRLPKAAGFTPRRAQGQSAAGGRAVEIAAVAARADEEHLPTAGQATHRYPNRVQSRVPSCGAKKLDICLGTCDDLVVDASQRTDTRGPGVLTRAPPPSGAAAPTYATPTAAANFLTRPAPWSRQPAAPVGFTPRKSRHHPRCSPSQRPISDFRATAVTEFRSHRH